MRKIIFLSSIITSLYCCKNKQTNEFELCNFGITRPYYYTGLQYEGELYQIRKHFDTNYLPIKEGNNSGIIKIKFNVDCNGISGDFITEMYTLNYKPTYLNKKLENQIISLVKSLDKWIPGKGSNGTSINSFMFIAVRIVDGEIIEIMPK